MMLGYDKIADDSVYLYWIKVLNVVSSISILLISLKFNKWCGRAYSLRAQMNLEQFSTAPKLFDLPSGSCSVTFESLDSASEYLAVITLHSHLHAVKWMSYAQYEQM